MKAENHRVLIIDDERPVLMTLEALLKRHSYHVDTAATASQGLKLVKSNSPSLVLLDLQLPDAHGLEMLDQIKTELPKAQVIILTAHDSLHNAIESIKKHKAVYCIAVGGAAYLVSKAIRSSKVLAFEDLGMEAIYEFDVQDMPVTVAVDSEGASVHTTGPAEWRKKIALVPA